jgi:Zn-finger nucleic acid-binding protein
MKHPTGTEFTQWIDWEVPFLNHLRPMEKSRISGMHAAYKQAKITEQQDRIQEALVAGIRQKPPAGPEEKCIDPFISQLASLLRQAHPRCSDRLCCECSKPFLLVTIDDTELDYCPRCHSFWFDTCELQHFTHAITEVPGARYKTRPSRYTCPVCREQMRESVFIKPFNLLVDMCIHRHGVYLEDQEIHRALELAGR